MTAATDLAPLLAFRYYRKRPRHYSMYCGVCGVRLADGTVLEDVAELAARNGLARPCCNQWAAPGAPPAE